MLAFATKHPLEEEYNGTRARRVEDATMSFWRESWDITEGSKDDRLPFLMRLFAYPISLFTWFVARRHALDYSDQLPEDHPLRPGYTTWKEVYEHHYSERDEYA